MTGSNQRPKGLVCWGGVAGFLVGGLVSTVSIWPDFFRRLRFSLNGGGGESSDWGEPLFYAAIFGVPWGVAGALVTMGVLFVVSSIGKPRNGS